MLGERGAGAGEKAGDRGRRIPGETRDDHRRHRPVRAADVVVEDVVDAGAGCRGRDVDVVLLNDRAREVREASVARVRGARPAPGSRAASSRASTPTGQGSDRGRRRSARSRARRARGGARRPSGGRTAPARRRSAGQAGPRSPSRSPPSSSLRSSSTALIRCWASRPSTPSRSPSSAHASAETCTARTGFAGSRGAEPTTSLLSVVFPAASCASRITARRGTCANGIGEATAGVDHSLAAVDREAGPGLDRAGDGVRLAARGVTCRLRDADHRRLRVDRECPARRARPPFRRPATPRPCARRPRGGPAGRRSDRREL